MNINLKDRSAVSTLKGYFYQFDFTILQLLKLKNVSDKIIVEGIEDIDISTADAKIAIQCKYYEGTEYNHSVIADAIKYLLIDFAERKRNGSKKIKYMLYGYYSNGQDKFPKKLDVSFLKTKFLTHKRKIQDSDKYEIIEEYKSLMLTDKDLEEFIELLKIDIYAQEFQQQMQDIFKTLVDVFKCTLFEAEHYYYNNALNVIKSIAIYKAPGERELSKGEFLRRINKKEILFNKWFYFYRTQKEVFRKIRKEYFSSFNISPYERFFLIDVGSNGFDLIILKDLVYLLNKKWAKCTKREEQPFSPYIYFHNVSDEQLAAVKSALFKEGFVFIDGYPFYMSDFQPDALLLPTTYENKIGIKFVNKLEIIEQIIPQIHKKVEIYQFYINEIFYESSENVKHIKIQIEKTESVKEIV